MDLQSSLMNQIRPLLLDEVIQQDIEIGRGTYATVFEVQVHGLRCAGKRLHVVSVLQQNDEFKKKFVAECLLHSYQRHPNIVQLIGVCITPEPTLVMEYLPMNLTSCLESHQGLPEWIKSSILSDISKGLNFLHNQKAAIAHFGVTSNNVLLTAHLQAKITDLCVSRLFKEMSTDCLGLISDETASNHLAFMPPEYFTNHKSCTTKFDIFSFGCIMIHVLSQEYPNPSEKLDDSFIDTAMTESSFTQVSEWERREHNLADVSSHHPLLPLIENCLDNNPEERPQISEVIRVIENASPPTPSPYSDGIIALMEMLNKKDSQVREARKAVKTKVNDLQEILNAKTRSVTRLENAVEKTKKECNGIVTKKEEEISHLQSEVSSNLATINDLKEKAAKQEKQVKSLQTEIGLQSTVIEELEQKMQKRDDKLLIMEGDLAEKESKIDELKKIASNVKSQTDLNTELQQEMKVMLENQERLQAITSNQQAQIDSLHQQLNTTMANNVLLETTKNDLVQLQDTILQDKADIIDQHQAEVTALRAATDLTAVRQQALELEINILQEENKQLTESTVSLKESLDTTMRHLKEQTDIMKKLSPTQDRLLEAVANININGPPLSQQDKIIQSMMKQRLIEGDSWCIVSALWFEKWKMYVKSATRTGVVTDSPGPVTNFMLLERKSHQRSLKDNLSRGTHYILIPEIAWDLLIQWYGLSEQSTHITRKVVKIQRHAITEFIVEVYPLHVQVTISSSKTLRPYTVQRSDKVSYVMEKLRKKYNVGDSIETRLWLYHESNKTILKPTDTMGCNQSHYSVETNDTLLLETKIGTWSIQESTSNGHTFNKPKEAKLSCIIPSDGQHILLKSNPSYMYKHLSPVIPSFKESDDYETMLS